MELNKMNYSLRDVEYLRSLTEFSSYISIAFPSILSGGFANGLDEMISNPSIGIASGTLLSLLVLESCFHENIVSNSVDIKNLKVIYKEVVRNLSNLMKTLEQDDPVSVFSSFVFLERSGNLSPDKSPKYDMDIKDFKKLYGMDVLRGKGVCRSFASMLNDVYTDLGYDSKVAAVYASDESIKNLKSLSILDKPPKDEVTAKKVKKIIQITKVLRMANHLITLVSDHEKSYAFDPTNDGFLLPDKTFSLFTSGDKKTKMVFKPFTTFRFSKNIPKVLSKLRDSTITREEYEKLYLNSQQKMIDNMDLIEKFYSENQELFEEITSKMDTMPGLVSRFFPIYAALKKYCDPLVSPKSLN